MAYDMYMDGVLMPVTPSKITMKIKNQNKTINLINDGEVNILKAAGLTEISYELTIPQMQQPFAVYTDGFKSASYFLDKFEKLKSSKQPFQFIVSRSLPNGKLLFDTNIKVSLEEYQIEDDVKEGFDLSVSIKLKQYVTYGTKKLVVQQTITSADDSAVVLASVQETRDQTTAPKETSYTVQSGDGLWLH